LGSNLTHVGVERQALRLARDGYYDKAIGKLTSHADKSDETLDWQTRGWLFHIACRFADMWGNADLARELERRSCALNRNLHRPRIDPPYVQLPVPGKGYERGNAFYLATGWLPDGGERDEGRQIRYRHRLRTSP
jgi:hypothetical protein